MTVISVLAGGKILAKETGTAGTIDANENDYAETFNVTMNDLRKVDTVVNVKLTLAPEGASMGEAVGAKHTGNVVGFTVVGISSTPTGCTVTPEVIATGYA